jgi:hypothetical protein
MIPEPSRQALLQAMQRFDADLRDTPAWASWPEQAGSHHWAISQDDRLYPVKQIIAMATGQATSGLLEKVRQPAFPVWGGCLAANHASPCSTYAVAAAVCPGPDFEGT